MGNVKSSLAWMRKNNEDGCYDRTIEKNKDLLKYFIKEVPIRIEEV